jgi:hypothetical protein
MQRLPSAAGGSFRVSHFQEFGDRAAHIPAFRLGTRCGYWGRVPDATVYLSAIYISLLSTGNLITPQLRAFRDYSTDYSQLLLNFRKEIINVYSRFENTLFVACLLNLKKRIILANFT